MKKLLLLAALLISAMTFAQVPQGISYQAIALNGSGNPVVSSNVGVRLSVLDVSATGTALYTETQTKTTTAQGLFNLVIGQGTPVSGTFAGINWKTNSKFLKVEMDIAGGTNYVLVGTTQLLSVPYALAAKSLVLAPGEGITLTSPNGTPYQLGVNNNGELSLPTSTAGNTNVTSFYIYGSFNSWNAAGALQFQTISSNYFRGYKYFAAGTQIKFLAAQNENVVYGGGSGLTGSCVINGGAITIPSAGFYRIRIDEDGSGGYGYQITNINVEIGNSYTMPYNVAGNYFSYTWPAGYSAFKIQLEYDDFGDNIADGTLEENGADIVPQSSSVTYLYKFFINFNGTGNYTHTP